jgi:hypothetical protein
MEYTKEVDFWFRNSNNDLINAKKQYGFNN